MAGTSTGSRWPTVLPDASRSTSSVRRSVCRSRARHARRGSACGGTQRRCRRGTGARVEMALLLAARGRLDGRLPHPTRQRREALRRKRHVARRVEGPRPTEPAIEAGVSALAERHVETDDVDRSRDRAPNRSQPAVVCRTCTPDPAVRRDAFGSERRQRSLQCGEFFFPLPDLNRASSSAAFSRRSVPV